jgi:hypothetical protein
MVEELGQLPQPARATGGGRPDAGEYGSVHLDPRVSLPLDDAGARRAAARPRAGTRLSDRRPRPTGGGDRRPSHAS